MLWVLYVESLHPEKKFGVEKKERFTSARLESTASGLMCLGFTNHGGMVGVCVSPLTKVTRVRFPVGAHM